VIEWLVTWGRFFIVIGAISIISICVVAGWNFSSYRLLGAAFGFLFGSGIAGTIFGVAAAIFDIQENVRRIAERSGGSGGGLNENLSAYTQRTNEPRLG
jgi:hypothetical protein